MLSEGIIVESGKHPKSYYPIDPREIAEKRLKEVEEATADAQSDLYQLYQSKKVDYLETLTVKDMEILSQVVSMCERATSSIDVIAYFVYASKENPNEAWSHLDEALCDYLSPQIDRLRKDVIDKVKSAAESKLTDAKIFTKWLDDRQEDLEKISGFLGS